ncbi:hypothetical protein VFPPC_05393 [Pochonia chlamydosporia 170]|uniref:Uncharacterized protein n=1 Tax=Pochonia chlamydosporia 170 TaxID=1380566 RepID=A0A179FFI1_METCM|nr:hypothetical protein VFPPC_05393 [Pochonia chlamydosporia 170]OAQ64050.1 hypothetical protein VFPPC_05393 [Pochonia chlamydosporia 170]
MASRTGSKDGVQCWVAAGDVEMRRQSFTACRATSTYFHLPGSPDVPQNTEVELMEDIREGLKEVFDSLDCRAPFIPGYKDKDDAIARAKLLRSKGREGLDIMLVCLTQCVPPIKYRRLDNYAEGVSYRGAGLNVPKDLVYIICEPFTKANLVDRSEVDWRVQD